MIELGFEIPDAELKERVFGEATQKAVLGFQQQNVLKETGVVDDGSGDDRSSTCLHFVKSFLFPVRRLWDFMVLPCPDDRLRA